MSEIKTNSGIEELKDEKEQWSEDRGQRMELRDDWMGGKGRAARWMSSRSMRTPC